MAQLEPKYVRRTTYSTFTKIGYEVVTDSTGDTGFYYNGTYKNDFGPCVIYKNGSKIWLNDNYTKNTFSRELFVKFPWLIVQMKAWELFEPEELVRLKNIKRCDGIYVSKNQWLWEIPKEPREQCKQVGKFNVDGKYYCRYHVKKALRKVETVKRVLDEI